MLQLLQPIWLWASAGIIVPILIHLWHIKRGKTLKVGSIIFLQENSKQQSTSFKISEWLLLLLRCLLIILLAVVLAKPQWNQASRSKNEKGWLVIEKENFIETYHHFKSPIDSLLLTDYELHYLEEGFKKANLRDSLSSKFDVSNSTYSYWQLAKQLDEQAITNKPIYLFTKNQLRNFIGSKPAIAKRIKWLTYLPKDTATTWLNKVYKTTIDSIKIITGKSNLTNTFYTPKTVLFNDGKQDKYSINKQNLSIRINDQKPILIDTSTLIITIFTDNYFEDANYVKAALDAIQQFSKQQIKTSIISDTNKLLPKQDWLFWLSDLPLKNLKPETKIIKYNIGKISDSATWMTNKNITTTKSVLATTNNVSIWQDGFGNSLLSIDSINPNIYHFNTHFNPSWNDIVWNENFPKLMLSILSADNDKIKNLDSNDKRILDEQQLHPISKNTIEQIFIANQILV
ncbi:MAG: BatA domain-containing protein [Pedobacter sp.]|nr:BatA domain-containing protein [Chitinophagaceae bacterium]